MGVEALRVAIDARLSPGISGGVAQAILGLVRALGQLDDGDERYAVVVEDDEQDAFIRPHLGPREELVRTPVAERGGLGTRVAERVSRRRNGNVPRVLVSSGFHEQLGEVVHFPHQRFVLCAAPTVYNPHDLQHLHFPQFFTPEIFRWREVTYRAACDLSDTVAVASQWVKDDVVAQYGIAPPKVQVIPWGPSTEAYRKPDAATLERVRSDYALETPFFLYPANTWPHKNHAALFEAMARLRDTEELRLRLVCTGAIDEGSWTELDELLTARELRDQVRFLGFVPADDLRALYALAQALVLPTLFESDSFPIFEAWLEGLPVACSNVTSLPHQAADAALIFEPDPTGIATALAALARDEALRDELRARGYRRLSDFDWLRTARAYRALYRRAARRPLTDEDRHLLTWDWMRDRG